jgi:AraC-like DNA-binding protein
MLTIVIAVQDSLAARKASSAFRDKTVVRCRVEDLSDETLRPGVAVVVFGPDAVARFGSAFFERLRKLLPSLVFAAYLPNNGLLPHLAFELGQAGIDLCVRDIDDHPTVLRKRVEEALSKRFVAQAAISLAAAVPRLEHAGRGFSVSELESVLLRVNEMKTAGDLAYSLGMKLSHLRSTLRIAGLPNPRRFLAWCRIIIAARLLEDEARTVESVALWLDYASGPSFRNACRKLAHHTPTEIRKGGGLAYAAGLFEQQVEAKSAL